jgi:hypothetical protein
MSIFTVPISRTFCRTSDRPAHDHRLDRIEIDAVLPRTRLLR